MSHNLHLIVVSADDPVDACLSAEAHMEGYNTSGNNYHTVLGCISEEGEVYSEGGQWNPKELLVSNSVNFILDKKDTPVTLINKKVASWFTSMYEKEAKKTMQDFLKGTLKKKYHNNFRWYEVKKFAEVMEAIDGLGKPPSKFNVLEDTLFEGQYTRNGVTQANEFDADGKKKYVVFIDMHS